MVRQIEELKGGELRYFSSLEKRMKKKMNLLWWSQCCFLVDVVRAMNDEGKQNYSLKINLKLLVKNYYCYY